MTEAVDVAVQLKSDRIREEAQAKNQQFLDSIDEGIKKVIKEQFKSEVSKITPQIEKLVNKQLESEVLVRSSKEAKTSHAVVANLSELELKKILIDKMEANKSINRPRDGVDADHRNLGNRPGVQKKKTNCPVEENMPIYDLSLRHPAHQEFDKQVSIDEQQNEEVHPLPDWMTAFFKVQRSVISQTSYPDIEDMLLLLMAGKNVLQEVLSSKGCGDLQLGVDKLSKINLNSQSLTVLQIQFDRRDAYTTSSDPRGFI
ncbi:hypothetical protein Tco_0428934 [Tanacetum coccineum]